MHPFLLQMTKKQRKDTNTPVFLLRIQKKKKDKATSPLVEMNDECLDTILKSDKKKILIHDLS